MRGDQGSAPICAWIGVSSPMIVDGPGLVDLAYWRQDRSFAVHLINYNNPMTMAGAYREIIPAGPYAVSLELPAGAEVRSVALLESGQSPVWHQDGRRITVSVPKIEVHEVVAIDLV